jgi:uridine phosphorylase
MVDRSPCIINPKKSKLEPRIGSPAILVPVQADLERMIRLFRGPAGRSKISGPQTIFPAYRSNFLHIFEMAEAHNKVTVAGPAVGAPQMAIILEKLIVLGARQVVMMGWAGGILPSLSPGDLILPDEALSEEGTSRHYSDEKRSRPSARLLQALQKGLDKEGLSFKQGSVWTTDAFYRETADKVQAFQSQGVLGVDMETSAFFTVSAFRGIEAAALLLVSDDLSSLTWRHGFREPRFLEARKQVSRFLYQFAIRSSIY